MGLSSHGIDGQALHMPKHIFDIVEYIFTVIYENITV